MTSLNPSPGTVGSQTTVSCGSGYSTFINTTTAGTVNGFVSVGVSLPTSNTMIVSRIVIRSNGQPIGRAQPNGSTSYSWSMPWVSSLHADGNFLIDAEVSFNTSGGGISSCIAQGMNVYVYNPTDSNLTALISPDRWDGPMSFGFPFTVQPQVNTPAFDPTPYSLYSWSATIGNITPNLNTAQYFSGQTEGTGKVIVTIRYGGDTAELLVPITVNSPDSPLPEPTGNDTSGTTTESVTGDTTPTTETAPRIATVQNNPIVQDCIVTALGEKRFEEINSGASRPTLLEVLKFNACFASSNYILPSNFSPVPPASIRELPKSADSAINRPENITRQRDEAQIQALKLSGRAKPNSLVLIYVFSDPLVLTTSTDDNGEWTYVLEDPIEPGSHEVYSVVDRGDGVYERSDPLSFVIETAEAADANPAGLSLRLADETTPAQSNRSMLLYAIASAMMLLVVVTGLIVVLKKHRRATIPAMQTTPVTPEQSPPIIEDSSPKPPQAGT